MYRWGAALVVGAAMVIADIYLLMDIWQYWILPVLVTPYRLINLARYVRFRLLPRRLQGISLRAQVWLVAAQLVLASVGLLAAKLTLMQIVGIIAGLQLAGVLTLLRVSLQTWEHAKPQDNTKHFTDKELPSLSVLIPARDETEALQTCLQSLIANDYPKLEIIVLDDCSINRRTPEIIRSFAHDGVRFVSGQVPPEDWVAKNYAYEQLRQEACGELLLFCGVDTTFEPRTLRALVETMLIRDKEMLSVLPTRPQTVDKTASFLQSMRYYWELCLPRRLFKRPPVLSTCWLIRAATLEAYGGLSGMSQSVSPEANFAKRAVIEDRYTFVRSSGDVQVHSFKTMDEQYETTVRLRYPQLHRRLELVVFAVGLELFFFLGPFIGLPLSFLLPHASGFFAIWVACVCIVETMYYLIAVQTKLNKAWFAFLTAPVGFVSDIVMLHVSVLRYEFGEVNWKGRNICIPVMRVEPHLPKLPPVSDIQC
ncbi:glycosyltransferase family 2 protein [Candidatus Saccharibacteria bacterium]|nr:glycosyltransferase family 2 protein [Candidatus Saccharibacteria bacterium]